MWKASTTAAHFAHQDGKVKARIAELFQFVLQMAKYDVMYDIRDRTRMAKTLLFSTDDSEAGICGCTHALEYPCARFPTPTDELPVILLGHRGSAAFLPESIA